MLVATIILSTYSFIEGLINIIKLTDEGFVFTDGTYIKFEDISEINFNKAMFSIGDKKSIIKIKCNENKYEKSIILKDDNLYKMKNYLERNKDLDVKFEVW